MNIDRVVHNYALYAMVKKAQVGDLNVHANIVSN